jgi:hypothetical protein
MTLYRLLVVHDGKIRKSSAIAKSYYYNPANKTFWKFATKKFFLKNLIRLCKVVVENNFKSINEYKVLRIK